MESILRRSVKGIDNAFGLAGSGRVAPPGLDLGLPATPVLELGRFAEYGCARDIARGQYDGWGALSLDLNGAGAATFNSTGMTLDEANVPGSKEGDNFWLWRPALYLIASATVADFGSATVEAFLPPGIVVGTGTLNRLNLLYGSASGLAQTSSALEGFLQNGAYPVAGGPLAVVPYNSSVNLFLFQAAAAGTVNVRVVVPFRVLPPGVSYR